MSQHSGALPSAGPLCVHLCLHSSVAFALLQFTRRVTQHCSAALAHTPSHHPSAARPPQARPCAHAVSRQRPLAMRRAMILRPSLVDILRTMRRVCGQRVDTTARRAHAPQQPRRSMPRQQGRTGACCHSTNGVHVMQRNATHAAHLLRKPCLRFQRRGCGWYVRLMHSSGAEPCSSCWGLSVPGSSHGSSGSGCTGCCTGCCCSTGGRCSSCCGCCCCCWRPASRNTWRQQQVHAMLLRLRGFAAHASFALATHLPAAPAAGPCEAAAPTAQRAGRRRRARRAAADGRPAAAPAPSCCCGWQRLAAAGATAAQPAVARLQRPPSCALLLRRRPRTPVAVARRHTPPCGRRRRRPAAVAAAASRQLCGERSKSVGGRACFAT